MVGTLRRRQGRRGSLGVLLAFVVAIGLLHGPRAAKPASPVSVSSAVQAAPAWLHDVVLDDDGDDDPFGGAHAAVLPDLPSHLPVEASLPVEAEDDGPATPSLRAPALGRAPPTSLPA